MPHEDPLRERQRNLEIPRIALLTPKKAVERARSPVDPLGFPGPPWRPLERAGSDADAAARWRGPPMERRTGGAISRWQVGQMRGRPDASLADREVGRLRAWPGAGLAGCELDRLRVWPGAGLAGCERGWLRA